jgi:hypothetical protein
LQIIVLFISEQPSFAVANLITTINEKAIHLQEALCLANQLEMFYFNPTPGEPARGTLLLF